MILCTICHQWISGKQHQCNQDMLCKACKTAAYYTDATGEKWCKFCEPRYRLMNLGAAQQFPAVQSLPQGAALWKIQVARLPLQSILALLVVLEGQEVPVPPSQRVFITLTCEGCVGQRGYVWDGVSLEQQIQRNKLAICFVPVAHPRGAHYFSLDELTFDDAQLERYRVQQQEEKGKRDADF